jgi:hypothetical protein
MNVVSASGLRQFVRGLIAEGRTPEELELLERLSWFINGFEERIKEPEMMRSQDCFYEIAYQSGPAVQLGDQLGDLLLFVRDGGIQLSKEEAKELFLRGLALIHELDLGLRSACLTSLRPYEPGDP